MITRLPEDICCHILTFLPITHAVATSVLCKKWKNLWTSASFTNLELDDRLPLRLESSKTMYNYASLFATFVINVLRLINLPCIRKLAFFCSDPNNLNCINSWLLRACTSNTVEVEIRISYTENPIELPQILYVSTPLLVLKLNGNIRLDFPPHCVCFPSLKVLWIKVYSEDGISVTENLFHICRVLEDLFIEGRPVNGGDIDYSFAVDCPNVKNLELCDDFLAKYRITADYGKLELYFEVNHSNRAFELLETLSNVKSLSLSGSTTGAVSYSYETRDNLEEIALQIRLRNFAKIVVQNAGRIHAGMLGVLPSRNRDLGSEGAFYEFTVVEFLLAHAEVLRKMTIHVQEEVTPDAAMRFRDQVLQYPRASEACQVEIISTKNMEN
ncbi:putative F-box/LRR-repeat protein At3g42770 [Malus domestica]|uniref:putative F-box/LRR-repeat protein At3g42770 n=1 Tax=Malus domestica TaxID=3750 RepID=UPI0039747C4E